MPFIERQIPGGTERIYVPEGTQEPVPQPTSQSSSGSAGNTYVKVQMPDGSVQRFNSPGEEFRDAIRSGGRVTQAKGDAAYWENQVKSQISQPAAQSVSQPVQQMQYPTQNLQPGMSGQSVKQLQDWLISQGYSIPAGATGYYGDQTKAAVTQWQRANNVDNSTGPGYWGPRSIAAAQKTSSGGTQSSQSIQSIQAELANKQAQMAALQKYGLEDTNQLTNTGQGYEQVYNTGNEQMDEILNTAIKPYLDQIIASGKIVNPNIELSPSEIQSFIDQAEKEINPYYASKISSIKDGLVKNIENLQKQYQLEKEGDEAQFKESLDTSRESAAGRGTIFSGGRMKQEQAFEASTQRKLDLDALKKESTIGSELRKIEGEIGSTNLPTFSPLTSSIASTSGFGGFGQGRTLNFSPTGGVIGSIPSQQTFDIQKRRIELETAKRQGRVLDFYNT